MLIQSSPRRMPGSSGLIELDSGVHPLGVGRGCPRKGEAVVVKPTSRQQPRTKAAKALKDSDPLRAEARVESYAPDTRLIAPSDASNCGF